MVGASRAVMVGASRAMDAAGAKRR